jgi:hypothetical protein
VTVFLSYPKAHWAESSKTFHLIFDVSSPKVVSFISDYLRPQDVGQVNQSEQTQKFSATSAGLIN